MKRLLLFIISLVFFNFLSFSQINLDSGLVVFYPFNGNTDDWSGNENNCTAYGGGALTTDNWGQANKAFSFDGVDDYLKSSDSILISGTQPRTICAWIKFNSIPASKISMPVSWGWDGIGPQPYTGIFSIAGWGYNGGSRFAMWGLA
ncbi:MAG: hypothetical protein U9R19_05355, partial [Bacteroidota bacterium]|nr:hypothetical protein [Bacteroidota bacterium]